jgi:hypothetical protein
MSLRPQIMRGRPSGVLFCAYLCLCLTVCMLAQAPAAGQVARLDEQRTWNERYARARARFLGEEYAAAAHMLGELAETAATQSQRELATELASIARAKLAANATQPALRTTDELTTLYATAILYGLGTSAWLALQAEPNNIAGALIPFATLTPAAAGVIALADGWRPLRHGIPHAIAAGMYLGFGEGLWLAGFQRAYASAHQGVEHWGAQRLSTALWLCATGGSLAGGLIGAINRPTPGRVSFTASSAIWSGALGAFVAHALSADADERGQLTYIVGGLAYNAGLLGGIVFGPVFAPSVARVRYVDLGGLFGALLVGGTYALLVGAADSRVGMGLAAVGGALGLGVTAWATRDMLPDRSHDRLQPLIGGRASLRPTLVPAPGGFVAGLSGEL